MFKGLKQILKRNLVETEGCGFLRRRELEAWIEERLAPARATVFERHVCACSPCSFLAADLASFRNVVDRGLLPVERREFEAGRAVMHAVFRQEIDAAAERRRPLSAAAPWKWASGAAAAMLLLAVVAVPLLREGATPGLVELPGGGTYAAEPMAYSAPVTVRGGESASELWDTAGAAYEAGRYGAAARGFATIAERSPDSVDAVLYRGIALLMDGDAAAAVESLETARRLGEEQGLGGAAVHFYLGLAALDQGRTGDAVDSLRQAEAAGGAFGSEAAKLLERLGGR